jgi:hypothetical protein
MNVPTHFISGPSDQSVAISEPPGRGRARHRIEACKAIAVSSIKRWRMDMVRINVEFDKYNRGFKLLDREFGFVLKDGAEDRKSVISWTRTNYTS